MPSPWIILAAVIAIAAAGFKGYTHGRSVEQGIHAQDERDSERLAAAILQHKQRRVDALSADLAAVSAKQIPKDREIIREVIRYETIVPTDRRCLLDGTWRLLHDAAATGEPASAASMADRTAPAVTDAAALETVAGNYETCRDWRTRLDGWERWWDVVKPLSP